jgi:hypothetical protein
MNDALQDALDRLIRAVIQYENSMKEMGEWGPGESSFKEKLRAEEEYAEEFDKYLSWKIENYLLNRFEDDR